MTRPLDNVRATAIIATAALLAGACGGARARPTPLPSDTACTVAPTPAPPAESASVVSTWAIDPSNVSMPSNPGERFVFAHAYETLIRVDCRGRVVPGLARSWRAVDGGTRWRLVVRDSARFWNGDALTAADVVAGWRATGAAASAVLTRRLAEGAVAIDDSTLEVALPDSPLAALGDPASAVMRRDARARWPEGTGPYRIRDAGTPSRNSLLLEPASPAVGPRVTIHSSAASGARDLVDAGIDLLLTDDPALAAYAAARPEFASMPLAWDRTWALLAPRQPPLGATVTVRSDSLAALTLGFRSTLARDAVRSDARPAEGPHWWSDVASCETLAARERTTSSPPVRSRVVFRRDEPTARALAERLVALAAIGRSDARDSSLALLAPALLETGARATAAALSSQDFATALRAGSELAFVVSLPRHSLAPCRDVERLLMSAPWLATGQSPVELSRRVAPLVDTRLHAVVRRNRLGLTMQWDSTVTIATPAAAGSGARP